MNHKVENTLTRNVNEENYKSRLSEIMILINTEKLNIIEEREIFHIMKIIMAVTFQNLIQNFAKEIPFDESVKNYALELSLLKKGFIKGQINESFRSQRNEGIPNGRYAKMGSVFITL